MTGKRTQIQPSDTTNMSQSETDAVNILFATNNVHKLMEVQAVLGPRRDPIAEGQHFTETLYRRMLTP